LQTPPLRDAERGSGASEPTGDRSSIGRPPCPHPPQPAASPSSRRSPFAFRQPGN